MIYAPYDATNLIKQLHHRSSERRIVFGQLRGKADERYAGSRALDHTSCRILLYHLHQRHAIMATHLVEQTDRMVLRHVVGVAGCHTAVVCTSAEAERKPSRGLGRGSGLLSFALPSPHNVASYRKEVI